MHGHDWMVLLKTLHVIASVMVMTLAYHRLRNMRALSLMANNPLTLRLLKNADFIFEISDHLSRHDALSGYWWSFEKWPKSDYVRIYTNHFLFFHDSNKKKKWQNIELAYIINNIEKGEWYEWSSFFLAFVWVDVVTAACLKREHATC